MGCRTSNKFCCGPCNWNGRFSPDVDIKKTKTEKLMNVLKVLKNGYTFSLIRMYIKPFLPLKS